MWACRYVLDEICYLWNIFYTKFIYILCKFYLVRSFDYSWNNNLIMLKEKYVLYFKTLFCYWATFKWSEKQIFAKLFQCCFLNVKATPMNKLNFHFQLNIKVEKTLIYGGWINVILFVLFQRCFINVETTSINICLLNFHFQSNFNVEATLFYRRWTDVILSKLFQRYFTNVEITSINVRRLNFHFQSNINVETTSMNVDD